MESLKTVVTVGLEQAKFYQKLLFSSASWLLLNKNSSSSTLNTSTISFIPSSPIPDKGILFLERLTVPNKFAFQNTSQAVFAYSIGANDYSLNLSSSQVSFSDIVADLNTYFAANTPPISVTYDSNTGSFTFAYAGAVGDNMIIKFAYSASLSNQLTPFIFGGLAKNYTLSPGGTLTLGLAALGPLSLLVSIDQRASNVTTDFGMLAQFEVPINVNYNDILSYTKNSGETNIAGCYAPFSIPPAVTRWNISLVDNMGVTYTLSNVVWDICIGLYYS